MINILAKGSSIMGFGHVKRAQAIESFIIKKKINCTLCISSDELIAERISGTAVDIKQGLPKIKETAVIDCLSLNSEEKKWFLLIRIEYGTTYSIVQK